MLNQTVFCTEKKNTNVKRIYFFTKTLVLVVLAAGTLMAFVLLF